MLFNFLFASLVAASISSLWRNLLDEPRIKTMARSFPYLISRALTCGFCFTYWTSLAVIAIFHLFLGWHFYYDFTPPILLLVVFNIGIEWMVVSFFAAIFYYILAILQEVSTQLVHRHVKMH